MPRVLLTIICLIPASVDTFAQDRPFTSKTARDAQRAYEKAIAKAKEDYVAQLEIAIREAGGAGDLADANRIAAEKDNIGTTTSDSLESLRRRLIGTRWNNSPSNPNNWLLFKDRNSGVDYRKQGFTWFVMGENTVVYQYTREFDSNIYMFVFDPDGKTATGHAFKKHSKTFPVKRVK